MCRSNGKQPDGVTIAPWKTGCTLTWDATCTDTFAASNLSLSTSEPRAAAGLAEQRKSLDKYQILVQTHHFIPIVIETSGAFGCEPLEFFAECGRCTRAPTQEAKSRAYLIQQVSITHTHTHTHIHTHTLTIICTLLLVTQLHCKHR